MKLIKRIYKTALYLAIEKGNIEIIKLLLNCENIDVNIPYVFFIITLLIEFILKYLNRI